MINPCREKKKNQKIFLSILIIFGEI